MASSPPAPYSSSIPNLKKRPSVSSQVSQSASKRPKLHPLRQTSFPAKHDAATYASTAASARSETGSVANSTFSTLSASKAQPRGRGRPRKSLQITEDDTRTARQSGNTGGSKKSQAKSVVSAARSAVGENAEAEPDEDDEDEIDDHEDDEDAQRRDEERNNILVNQLTESQRHRYTQYRASKLNHAVVRRMVNQTVSQSVTQTSLQIVQFFTKAFAVEIVERAREVQTEYAAAAEKGIDLEKQARRLKVQNKEMEIAEAEKVAKRQDSSEGVPQQVKMAHQQELTKLKEMSEKYIPNKHKGGLLPDHLREALRRYKADGDGNGFGFDGLSHPLLGVQGSNTWRVGDGSTGQRLFR